MPNAWIDFDGRLLVDANGLPILCDECPCAVDTCRPVIEQWRAYCEGFGSSETGAFLMEAEPNVFNVAALPFYGETAIWRKYDRQFELEWKRAYRALWVAVDFHRLGDGEEYEDDYDTYTGPGFVVRIAVKALDCDCQLVTVFETDTAFYQYNDYWERWEIANYPEIYFEYGNTGGLLSLLNLVVEKLPEGMDACACSVVEESGVDIATICEQGPEESCRDNYVAHLVYTWTNGTGEDVSVHMELSASGCEPLYGSLTPIDNAVLLKLTGDPMPLRGWEADRNILDFSVPDGQTVQLYCLNGPSDDEIGKGIHPWYIAGTLSYRTLTCDDCAIKIEAALMEISDNLKTGGGTYSGTAYRAAYITVAEEEDGGDITTTITLFGWDCETCTLGQIAQVVLRNEYTSDYWTRFPAWTDDPSACDPEENPDADE